MKRVYVCVTSCPIVVPSCSLLHRCGKTSDFKTDGFPFFSLKFTMNATSQGRAPQLRNVRMHARNLRVACICTYMRVYVHIYMYTVLLCRCYNIIILRAGNNDAPTSHQYNRVKPVTAGTPRQHVERVGHGTRFFSAHRFGR